MSSQKSNDKASSATTAKAKTSSARSGGSRKKTGKKKVAARPAAATSNQAAASTAVATPAAAEGGSSSGMVRLALIASLLALAIAAYAAYQFTLSASVSGNKVAALEERLAFAVQQQQSLQSAFDAQEQALTADSKRLSDGLAEMQSTVGALQKVSQASSEEIKANLGASVARWKLDELQSLLIRVNRAYQLTGDQAQALTGLRLAQSSLNGMDNPRLQAVNDALAEDILQVESARQVDIAALHGRLLGMISMVPDLVLAEDTRAAEAQAQAMQADAGEASGDEAAQDAGLLAAGKTLIDDIGGLVKYKNLDAPLQPTLDAEGRFVVYEALKLRLQAAMAALISRDNDAYQAQLTLAEDSLNTYFDAEQAQTKTLADQLAVMRSYDIRLDVEAITQALNELDRVIVLEN